MDSILIWLLAAYGMSQILVYGTLFNKPRNWIKNNSKFFGSLISCIMCTSTWVGFLFSLVVWSPMGEFMTLPYLNVFFDGMLASGGVWGLNSIIEWFEENRPK